MSRIPSLVGLGQLVHDAFYEYGSVPSSKGLHYVGSRGGGSVWNILANAASTGMTAGGVGASGADPRRELVLEDNSALGIRDLGIGAQGSKLTASMHHIPKSIVPLLMGGHYQTTGKCVLCMRRPKSAALTDDARVPKGPDDFGLLSSPGIFVVDRATALRSDWAEELRRHGWFTTIDIGYSGYLRYRSEAEILGLLQPFGLVVLQKPVARFVAGKTHSEDSAGVAQKLGNIVVVSDGEQGLEAFDGRRGRPTSFKIPAPACDVVDTVGAGDALMAAILVQLAERGHAAGALKLSTSAFEDVCGHAMDSVVPVLANVGARGHLPGSLVALPGVDGLTVEDLPEGTDCPACGARRVVQTPSRGNARAPLSVRNLKSLRQRVRAIVEDGVARDQCRSILNDPVRVVFCGSGGSFSVAQALADVTNEYWASAPVFEGRPTHSGFAVARRPLEALASLPPIDLFVGVSYSGRSPDLWRAMEGARSAAKRLVLVTAGTVENRVGLDESIEIIRYGLSEGGSRRSTEKGFVSFAGVLGPVALWTAAATELDDVRAVLVDSELADEAGACGAALAEECGPTEGGLAVIGSGWTRSAMTDLESKFVEGSLAHVTIHDAKDFSHGRFMSLSGQSSLTSGVLVLATGVSSEYHKQLLNALRRNVEQVHELTSEHPGMLGGLELLLAVQSFAVEFAVAKGIDISRPTGVSRDWLDLYRWDGVL